MTRTQRGPLRPLWRAAYEATARLVAAWLVCRMEGATAYVRGSLGQGDPEYGLSDIDLVLLVDRRADRLRALKRFRAASRIPGLARVVGPPRVHERVGLELASESGVLTAGSTAVYEGAHADEDSIRIRERPGLAAPAEGWRRLLGPARPLPRPERSEAESLLAAWLELQYLWRAAYPFFRHPEWPRAALMCVKLIAEPARILLTLERSEAPPRRADVLAAAASVHPEDAEAFGLAGRWLASLGSGGVPPMDAALRHGLRLSGRIADLIASRLAPLGTTGVALLPSGVPILVAGGWPLLSPEERAATGTELSVPAADLKHLADWRAVVRPWRPDEAFARVAEEPADADLLGRLAALAPYGAHPLVGTASLWLMPSDVWWRGALRAVGAPWFDPVTAAQLRGLSEARFVEAPGLSVGDVSLRAVTEHRARLAAREGGPGAGRALSAEDFGALITAARAALLADSVAAGEPALPLGAEATLRTLSRHEGCERAATEALEAYRERGARDLPVPQPVSARLDQAVRGLRAYAA